MKIITIIYIFALYVLCIPGIFIKHKYSNLLYSFIFSIILYFTFSFINGTKEFLSENSDVDVEIRNLNNLVNKLNEKIETKINTIDVEINNNINFTPAQELDNITKTCLQKLEELEEYKTTVQNLKYEISTYDGLSETKIQLQGMYNKIKEREIELEIRIKKNNESIKDKNQLITSKNAQMSSLAIEIPDLSGNIIVLNDKINGEEQTIVKKMAIINRKNKNIDGLEKIIEQNKEIISSRDHEIDVIVTNIQKINNTIKEKLKIIQKNKDDITHLQEEITKKNDLMQGISLKKTNLQYNITDYKNTIKNLLGTKTEKTDQNTVLKNTISKQTDKLNKLNETLSNNSKYIESAHTNFNTPPNKKSCLKHWLHWLKTRCPKDKHCFSVDDYERMGDFTTVDGLGICFSFKRVYNSRRNNGSYWSAWTVANSWTNPNPYVERGETIVPMRYVKPYV
jgi:hypothetical protein